jgi:hypothetical protein
MSERIQRKRTKGWRMPDGAIYVGRPTKWGNPFIVGKPLLVERYYPEFGRTTVTPRDRREAVAWFSLILGHDWGLPVPIYMDLAAIRRDLRGRDLACWCPLDQPCHADILLEIASQEAQ